MRRVHRSIAIRRGICRARSVGTATNPAVATAEYNVDVALLAVKVAEGALYPTVSVQAQHSQNWLSTSSLSIMNEYNASVLGTLSVPIYQGGAEYSLIRQSKETLGQKRLDLDTARDQIRQNVVQAWGQFDAAKANSDADAGAGAGGRDRAQRRARGGPRRPAHHVRRAQRRSRRWSTPVSLWLPPSTIVWLRPIPCCRRSADCRRRCSDCTSRPTMPRSTTSRCATAGWACAPPTGAERRPARSGASVHRTLRSAAFRPAKSACPWRIKRDSGDDSLRFDDGRAARRGRMRKLRSGLLV